MNTLTLLKEARKVIAKPDNWTQGANARDEYGDTVSTVSSDAVCWCWLGSLVRVSGGDDEARYTAQLALQEDLHGCITATNDSHTHTEVMKAFDFTIARLEKAAA